jgi:type I restriction enzyme R subunit
MAHNENTRVKIPAILHLNRLGYQYVSLKASQWDDQNNIFPEYFYEAIRRINPKIKEDEIARKLLEINLALDNEDMGKSFFEMLTGTSGIRLIDFTTPENNRFHVVTELTYKNGEEEFRPDITLLINGMPLVFIEVKKPNNREGILAERNRIDVRSANKKFRRFINISQLLIFSNNMEYDTESIVPIQGAFYATTTYGKNSFHCFREEEATSLEKYVSEPDEAVEDFVLKDNNLSIIKHAVELATNKATHSPTNRILTSICSPERLLWLLKFGFAYVETTLGYEKHIMRYPQIFATKAIGRYFDDGNTKGIIWHTQGSGKTALAYYNVHFLTDYYRRKETIPKFYFIVDRIDLLTQAKGEFTARGLKVHTVDSKEAFAESLRKQGAIHNLQGRPEITVVNIHKFKDEPDAGRNGDYDISVQRIYFVDEAHRSFNPYGSFLANLVNSDRNAHIIALTGTPLIRKDFYSRDVFGNYIHKYYYNASIADGYTLKLIREGIETNYKMLLEETIREIEVLQGDVDRRQVYAHPRFVEPMLDYIVKDFEKSRRGYGENGIGAMVVCDSADQARMMHEIFQQKYATKIISLHATTEGERDYMVAAEDDSYTPMPNPKVTSASLILHDVGTKEDRKNWVDDFKAGKIDLLFVFNMLLTGFDAKRLKKLYLGRVVKEHNLLQTLTRVNRPFKNFRYGYVVDFADIRKEFDATNKAYFDELQQELGDEMEHYSNLFKEPEEIEKEIADIKELLFSYNIDNAEIFQQQISAISNKEILLKLKKALSQARELFNIIKLLGHTDLLGLADFKKLGQLYNEVSNHLEMLNLREKIEQGTDTTQLLNEALEDVIFLFRKVSEEELVLADKLKDALRKTREAMAGNFDKDDPDFVSLYDELKRLFKKKNLDEVSQDDMQANIGSLNQIYDAITELNRRNNLLQAKYQQDAKYARIHKRLLETGKVGKRDIQIYEALSGIKQEADAQVLQNQRLMESDGYFEALMLQLVVNNFGMKQKVKLDPEATHYIKNLVTKEYLNEFYGK